MAQITVSLNVLNNQGFPIELPATHTLDDVLTMLLRRDGGVQIAETLIVLGYRVTNYSSTLYELGVRAGDVLTLMPEDALSREAGDAPARGETLTIRTCTVYPTGDVLEVSDNARISAILPRLGTLLGKADFKPTLYIGRYVGAERTRLADLGLERGDLLGVAVMPTHAEHILVLNPGRGERQPFHISASPTLMGGFGPTDRPTAPAVDISDLLARRQKYLIQGAQVEFLKINGVWHIQLLPRANTPVFVDSQRLLRRRPKVLAEENVISFGTSPTEPLLTLVVQSSLE